MEFVVFPGLLSKRMTLHIRVHTTLGHQVRLKDVASNRLQIVWFDIAWVYMFCKWYPGKLGAEVSKLKRL